MMERPFLWFAQVINGKPQPWKHFPIEGLMVNAYEILKKNKVSAENIAYIGDDVNDLKIMEKVGFKATPADGTIFIKKIADYVCDDKSGNGAFREVAELIISFNKKNNQ